MTYEEALSFITKFYLSLKEFLPGSWRIDGDQKDPDFFMYVFGPWITGSRLLAVIKVDIYDRSKVFLHFSKAKDKEKTVINEALGKNKFKLPVENF